MTNSNKNAVFDRENHIFKHWQGRTWGTSQLAQTPKSTRLEEPGLPQTPAQGHGDAGRGSADWTESTRRHLELASAKRWEGRNRASDLKPL